MSHIELITNYDQSYDILFFLGEHDYHTEAALDFFVKHRPLQKIRNIVLIGTVTLTIPFSQITANPAQTGRYAMSYVFFGSNQQQLEYISVSRQSLGVISPSYFNLSAAGTLDKVTISSDYVAQLHQNGMKVVPFLSNHWDRAAGIAALENREALSTELANLMIENKLDGINVDIENVSDQYREAYTDLVRLLREKLPAEKEVSVAVAANPYGWTLGWHGSYDYEALGKIADHLFIMAYDEHFQGGDPGPVASLSFAEQSVAYALSYVPAEKIVLGIPFFGRIWSADGSISGLGLSCQKAETLISKYGATVIYDKATRSPKAEFTLTSNDSVKINGVTLPPGRYVIWYENSTSLKEKLALVDKYELKGAGAWSLGQETADVWDYFSLWLNGKYFEDIAGHFASDSILKAAEQGYMVGVNNTSFAPEESMTRAQAAAVCARILGLSDHPGSYSDTTGHWANQQIGAMEQAGLLFGYDDGTFRPDQPMTREEVSALLYRLLGFEYAGELSPFPDVQLGRWSYEEITALAGKNVLAGNPDGYFRPEDYLTRGEMAYLIQKIKKP